MKRTNIAPRHYVMRADRPLAPAGDERSGTRHSVRCDGRGHYRFVSGRKTLGARAPEEPCQRTPRPPRPQILGQKTDARRPQETDLND